MNVKAPSVRLSLNYHVHSYLGYSITSIYMQVRIIVYRSYKHFILILDSFIVYGSEHLC